MIQRIQSLFLLGVVIISILLFFLPFSEKIAPDAVFNLELNHVTKTVGMVKEVVSSQYLLMILNLFVAVLAFYTIFLFKNRKNQVKLCMLNVLFATLLLIFVFTQSESMLPTDVRPHYLTGLYLVALQIIFLVAAQRFIRKDEKLVRAADRIR